MNYIKRIKNSHRWWEKLVGRIIWLLFLNIKQKNIVEYALSRSRSPALVAKYQTELFDKQLLENKLDEFFRLAALEKRKDLE